MTLYEGVLLLASGFVASIAVSIVVTWFKGRR